MINEETLAALEQKHGKVIPVSRDEYDFVLRKPTYEEFRTATGEIFENQERSFDVNRQLVLACCVYPEQTAVDEILGEYAGLVGELVSELGTLTVPEGRRRAKAGVGPTPEQIASLKAANGGKIWILPWGDHCFVMRKPKETELRQKHMKVAADSSETFDANQKLVMTCVVSPDRVALKATIDEYPGLVLALGQELGQISALTGKGDAKKA